MTAGRKMNSQNQNWGTPSNYVEAIREFFGNTIDLDPCSNVHSLVKAKVEYHLPEVDGLKASWKHGTIFVNPPYGSDRERGTRIINWIEKCAEANRRFSSEVIALIPVATNTNHWKKYVWGQANSIAFLYDTRLKFLVDGRDGGKGAPMSCALVYWGKRSKDFKQKFMKFGAVIDLKDAAKPTNLTQERKRYHRQPRLLVHEGGVVVASSDQDSVRLAEPLPDLPLWNRKREIAGSH